MLRRGSAPEHFFLPKNSANLSPMSKKVFLSSSIPYVNAKPHIGHALEFVQADAMVRYRRLMGDELFFTSGTDDNALKNVLKAEEAGEDVAEYVHRHADTFRKLCVELNIKYDYFTETSQDEQHRRGAVKLWEAAVKSGNIYEKEYEGIYCVGCEEFKTEKDLNKNGECPEHPGKKPEVVQEKNYFFKLSKYQDKLLTLIESDELKITPEAKKNEILSFVRGGLEDFSVSRSVERARGWGILVPGNDSQVMYVWFDALSNYINALGYADNSENYTKFWKESDERIHVIGKGINRFHTVYWPAMLLSADIPLPTTVFVHGYFTVDGQKMSKTLGNIIDPEELISKYGTDAVRYYFLRHAHPFEDSDVTLEKFKEAYNANLVNGLGNLTARIMKMAEDNLDSPIERPESVGFDKEYTAALDNFEFQNAMDFVWKKVGELDERITAEEPFKLVKEDKEKGVTIIQELLRDLYAIGRMLFPFMPETNVKIKEAVLANKKPENLFKRLD